MITLRPYQPPSFLTMLGALAKVRQLKRRGFPTNLRNWRFITLTFDRERYPDPETAYRLGKRQLRQWLYLLRKRYSIKRWAWKLEFHVADEGGRIYPHWHVLLDYKRPINCEEIAAAWGKGRTEVQGITDSRFDYIFKYVTKELDYLPDWLLEMHRVRLFQTSPGFFPADGQREKQDGPSPRLGAVPSDTNTQNDRFARETIGERVRRWERSVVSRITLASGRFYYETSQLLNGDWGGFLVDCAKFKIARRIQDAQMQIEIWKIEVSHEIARLLPITRSAAALEGV